MCAVQLQLWLLVWSRVLSAGAGSGPVAGRAAPRWAGLGYTALRKAGLLAKEH